MKRLYAAATLAATSLTAIVPAYGGQRLLADASRPVPVQMRPGTLASFISQLAGLQVRLVSGVVDEIASSRVFTVKNERGARYRGRPNEVAVVVVDNSSAFLREGTSVVVTGIARTLLDAQSDATPSIPTFSEKERKLVGNRPLVIASSVQTPEGVQLMRRTP